MVLLVSRRTAMAGGGGGAGKGETGDTYKSRPTMFSNTELLPLD